MDKDRVEGELKDVKGRIKRQAGEWTGNKETQAEGALDQAEGKTQNAIGQAKDAARKAARDLDKKVNEDREKKDDAA